MIWGYLHSGILHLTQCHVTCILQLSWAFHVSLSFFAEFPQDLKGTICPTPGFPTLHMLHLQNSRHSKMLTFFGPIQGGWIEVRHRMTPWRLREFFEIAAGFNLVHETEIEAFFLRDKYRTYTRPIQFWYKMILFKHLFVFAMFLHPVWTYGDGSKPPK